MKNIFSSIIPKKVETIPEMSRIYINGDSGYIIAINNETYLKIKAPRNWDIRGDGVIDYSNIEKIFGRDLQLTLEDREAIVVTGKTKFKYPLYRYDRVYNCVDTDFEYAGMIRNSHIESGMRSNRWATKEENRYSLNSTILDFKNGLAVSTDYAQLRRESMEQGEINVDNIVLKKSHILILYLLIEEFNTESIKVYNSKGHYKFQSMDESWTLAVSKIETRFPNYRDIKCFDDICSIKTSDIKQAVKDLKLVYNSEFPAAMIKENNLVRIDLKSNTGEVSCVVSEETNPMAGEYSRCCINLLMVEEYIKHLVSNKIDAFSYCGTGEPRKPIVFKDKLGELWMSPVAG